MRKQLIFSFISFIYLFILFFFLYTTNVLTLSYASLEVHNESCKQNTSKIYLN